MTILLYEWEAYLQYDIKWIFREEGIVYDTFSWKFTDKNADEEFKAWFEKSVDPKKYDAIFSFNYWPVLSEAAQQNGICYLAWCYDNPLNVFRIEETLGNPVNRVFFFDRVQAEQYMQAGFDTVYYLPLGVNGDRLRKLQISSEERLKYNADVSLVGSLYESRMQDLRAIMDNGTRGYLDAVMAVQQNLYGCYLFEELVSGQIVEEINCYVKQQHPDTSFHLLKEALTFAMASEVTRKERLVLLTLLGRRFDTRLYSFQNSQILQGVKCFPVVDYVTEMPKVFASSKVNLNPTLKCIQSGIPLRALDVMGAGGFLLSNYQPELAEQFADGEDMVMYESVEDAVAKADFYIKHEEIRSKIAANGRDKVLQDYTLRKRLKEILEIGGLMEKPYKYYIVSPAGIESGGPELTHQLCCELMHQEVDAKMYYLSNGQLTPVDVEAEPRYLKYKTTHVTERAEADNDNSVIIFNESDTSFLPYFYKAKKVLWWMSVDNYLADVYRLPEQDLRKKIDLHLVQSCYAYNYVKNIIKVPEERITFLSDYTHENFQKKYFPEGFRQDIVLYNPQKGFERLKPLIDLTPEVKWIPLVNLTEQQLMKIMQIAKVYIDFGNHPGKDRIPREAAVSGCCILTNKAGSAAFPEDVPIPGQYKFEHVEKEYDKIKALILDICNHFEAHSQNFDSYRQWITEEKNRFSKDTADMVQKIEELGN